MEINRRYKIMLKVKDLDGKIVNEVRYAYNENAEGLIMYLDTWKDLADCEIEKIKIKDDCILFILA